MGPTPTPAPRSSRAVRALASLPLLVALAAGSWVSAAYWTYSYDDAYITYRYAARWATTGMLEYNPGEPVLGTTAPGYALLLGLGSRLSGLPVAALGTLYSAISLVALTLLLQWLSRQAATVVRIALPVLFALLAFSSRWNLEMLGAETFVVSALGVGGAALALTGKQSQARGAVAGGLLAVAAACRLDALALAGIVGLAAWYRARRFPPGFALGAGLPLALWLGWLWHTFGRVVPVTLAAKHSELAASGQLSYLAAEWGWLRRTLPAWGAAALLVLALAGVAALVARRRAVADGALVATVVAAWLVVHEVAYRLVQVPFAPWYHVGLLQAMLAATAGGALAMTRWLAAQASARVSKTALTTAAPAVALAMLLPVLVPGVGWALAQRGSPPDPRYRSYLAVAQAIGRGARPGDTVATVEIGVLGYFASARVLDLAGLVTPEVVPARAAGTLPLLVAARAPEWIVDADAFRDVLAPVLAAPGTAGRYRQVLTVPHGDDPHRRLRLLRREPD